MAQLPRYHHLRPGASPPVLGVENFRAVIISDAITEPEWRNGIANWLVESGCLYAVAWGVDCEIWHDTIDEANLEKFDFGEIPKEKHIMTTWHDKETLDEALWFAGHCASHPEVDLEKTFVLHVSASPNEVGVLSTYQKSKDLK